MGHLPRPARVLPALLALAAAAWLPAQTSSGILFTGIVRDSLGKALPGAEILVLSDRGATLPIATAHTDEAGHFLIGDLMPGLYRVAAIKQGYLAYLGQVNTLLRTSMEVVLRPLPPVEAALPRDMSWALRLPDRSLLRETDPAELATRASGGSHLTGEALAESIQGQVEHLVALSWVPGSPGAAGQNRGARTYLRLHGAVGERARIRLEAERDDLERLIGSGDASTGASRDSSSLRLAAAYQPDAATKIEVDTYFGDRSLAVLPGGVATGQVFSESEHAWGSSAAWSRAVGSGSSVGLRVKYVDADIETPQLDAAAETSAPPSTVSSQSVGAEGWYETLAREDHQIRVGVGAHLLDPPGSELRGSLVSILGGFPDSAAGWTVRVRAEDEWALSRPFTVILGLDVDESLADGGPDFLIPRVGGAVTAGRWRARGTVEYILGADEPASNSGAALWGGTPLGYEAEIETALPGAVRLRGRYLQRPADTGLRSWDCVRSPTPYVTDGLAAVESASLGLEHQTKDVTLQLRVSSGRVEGRVASRLPFMAPLAVLEDRVLTHQSGRVGMRLMRTGTDVAAEYWVMEQGSPRGSETPAGLSERFLDLLLAQDLVQLRGRRASCRLLVSARRLVGAGSEDPPGQDPRGEILRALSHRVSAGLSVAF